MKRFNARLDLGQGDVLPATVRDIKEDFFASISDLSPGTQAEYGAVLGSFTNHINDRLISTIGAIDIDRFAQKGQSQGRSPSTIAKHLRVLSVFFNWAAKSGYAESNPVATANTTRQSAARQRPVIADATLNKIVNAIDTEDRKIAVWITVTTGMDRGMIAKLAPMHVDLQDACFRIIRPKTKKSLALPIHPKILPLLSRRLKGLSATDRILAGIARRGWAPKMGKDADWWRRACLKAGVEGVLFRDLRALAVRRLAQAGAALDASRRLLGHSSVETTARHYSMPDPDIALRIHASSLPGLPGVSKSKKVKSSVVSARA